jgi:hypothetical protein
MEKEALNDLDAAEAEYNYYHPPPKPEPEIVYEPYIPPGLHVVGFSGFIYLAVLIIVAHLLLEWIGL